MAGSVWAVVVAAGQGTRFGGQKQFAVLGGRTVLDHALSCVAASSQGIVVVVPPGDDTSVAVPGGVVAVPGRSSRAGSVRAGLEAVPDECEIVVVHDAARPLATPALCAAVVAAVRAGADGAIPGLRLTDTVKRVSGTDSTVVETVAREALVRVQTPQAFSADVLRRAHAGDPEATDDAGLVEAVGGQVVVVPGEESNVKITGAHDLELVQWWHDRLHAPDRELTESDLSR